METGGQGGRCRQIRGEAGGLVDVRSRHELESLLDDPGEAERPFAGPLGGRPIVATFPDEPLRVAVHRMAESSHVQLPVVSAA
jgi:hypothetical protein